MRPSVRDPRAWRKHNKLVGKRWKIDRSDPLAAGLIHFVPMTEGLTPIDYAGNGAGPRLLTNGGGTMAWRPDGSRHLLTRRYSGATNSYDEIVGGGTELVGGGSVPFTMSFWWSADVLSNGGDVASTGTVAQDGGPGLLLRLARTAGKLTYLFNSHSYIDGTGTIADNTIYNTVVTFDGGTGWSAYLNGVLDATDITGSNSFNFANIFLGIGFQGDLLGNMYAYAGWNRKLTTQEIAEHYAEPYRFMRPTRPFSRVGVVSGATNITLAQAIWNWTGNPAAFDAKQQLTLTQKAWNWTGQAPSVNAKTMLTLTQVPWHWNGTAPGVNAKTQITLTQKAWNWTGNAGSFVNGTVTTLAQAAWNWTGNAMTVNAKTMVTLAQRAWQWAGRVPPQFAGLNMVVNRIGLWIGIRF